MTTIVTDKGFRADDWTAPFQASETVAANDGGQAIDLAPDTPPESLGKFLGATMIRIDFPSFADGRGFTLARLLRQAGFTGRLRARGHVLADQYAMARRSGFDEIEIDSQLAERQSQAQWLDRAAWQDHNYQSRLRG